MQSPAEYSVVWIAFLSIDPIVWTESLYEKERLFNQLFYQTIQTTSVLRMNA